MVARRGLKDACSLCATSVAPLRATDRGEVAQHVRDARDTADLRPGAHGSPSMMTCRVDDTVRPERAGSHIVAIIGRRAA